MSQAMKPEDSFRIPPLVELCTAVKRRGGTLHLLGLIGSGGVHALDDHLAAAVRLGHLHDLPVAIHAWLDGRDTRSEEHTSELQSQSNLVCRLLLEKKKMRHHNPCQNRRPPAPSPMPGL